MENDKKLVRQLDYLGEGENSKRKKNSKGKKNSKRKKNSKGEKDSKGENSNKKKSIGEKLKGAVKPAVLLVMAVALFTFGVVGIVMGVFLALYALKNPLSKLAKKSLKSIRNKIEQKRNNYKRLKSSNSLEMDATTLNQMKTRRNSVSNIQVIPKEKAKSTSNGLQTGGLNFDRFTKSAIDLSEGGKKLREKSKSRPALSRSQSLPDLKNLKPSM